MPSAIRIAMISLLAASAQAHTLHTLMGNRVLARQSSGSSHDGGSDAMNACAAVLEPVCSTTGGEGDEDIDSACADAVCGATCTNAFVAIATCCGARTADNAALAHCIDVQMGVGVDASSSATTLATSTSHAFSASSSSSSSSGHHTSTMSSTLTTTATTAAAHASGGVSSPTPSAPGKTAGTAVTSPTAAATTTGISVTSASVTPNPTGNAAGALAVAQAGGLGLGLVWMVNLLVL